MDNEIYCLYLSKLLLSSSTSTSNKELKEITNWIENKRKHKNSFDFFLSFFYSFHNSCNFKENLNKNELLLTSQSLLFICKNIQKQERNQINSFNLNSSLNLNLDYFYYYNEIKKLLFKLKNEENYQNENKIIIKNIYLCLSCLIIKIKNENINENIINILLIDLNNDNISSTSTLSLSTSLQFSKEDILEILLRIPELVLSFDLYSGDKDTIQKSIISLSSLIFQELPNILEYLDTNISLDLIFDVNLSLPKQYLSSILTIISEWLNISIALTSEYHTFVPFYDANTFLSSRYILILNESFKYLSQQNILLTDNQKDLFNSLSEILLNLLKLKWANETDQLIVTSMVLIFILIFFITYYLLFIIIFIYFYRYYNNFHHYY